MKKFATLLLGAAVAMTANALTMEDLQGVYTANDVYGYGWYVAADGAEYYGTAEGATDETNARYENTNVAAAGNKLYFSNFLGCTFYAEVDLEAGTVTVPSQDVNAPTGYTYTLCKYNDDKDTTLPMVMTLQENGDFKTDGYLGFYSTYNGAVYYYGYFAGTFHKKGELEIDAATAALAGTYTCTTFNGWWSYLWSDDEDDEEWHEFNNETGEGIDAIVGVTAGPFDVEVIALGGNNVMFSGLWWGGLDITGTYDGETRTATFPLQLIWDGYTLCSNSLNEVEAPTEEDVVPATAVLNEDGTITMNYCAEYYNFTYTDFEQILSPKAPLSNGADIEGTYNVVNFSGYERYWWDTSMDWTTFAYSDYAATVTAVDANLVDITGFISSDVVVRGAYDENAGTITFEPQTLNIGGYDYVFCKEVWNEDWSNDVTQPVVATINDGVIDLNEWTIVYVYPNGGTYAYFSTTELQLSNKESGIESTLVQNTDAPVEYFNLQGIRVANPANGLYIVRRGNNVAKQYIR